MTSQMIQDWVIGNKHQAGSEIIDEPKVFVPSRNNPVNIKALCSLSLPSFLCSQAGSDSKLVKYLNKSNIVHSFRFTKFTS